MQNEQYQTWAQMEWFVQYFPIFHRFMLHLTYLLFISRFTYSNVLHFDSNNSLDRSKLAPPRKKEHKQIVCHIYIMCIYFYQLFYHSWAICLQEHSCQIIIILESDKQAYCTCTHKWTCVWDQARTHNAQFPGVISRCVHTLVSIQYRWANSLGGSQPASDLHNIPTHTDGGEGGGGGRCCTCTNPIISSYLPVCGKSDGPG